MLKDTVKTKNEIVDWIREYFEQNGKGCKAVIGISGGKGLQYCGSAVRGGPRQRQSGRRADAQRRAERYFRLR